VDANAARVLRRVFHNNRRPPLTPAALRRLGLEALPEQRPGDFNQALMELGALICAPSRPNCKECPLTDRCRWSPAGTGPVHRRTSIKPITKVAAVVLTRRGRVLIAQRPPVGLWAGLWEFPWQEVPADEESLETSLRLLINDLGLQTGKWEALTTLRYGVMSRRYHLNAFSAQVCAGRARSPRHAALRWVPPDQLPGYAFPSPHARLVAKLLQG
jgi:A/G-specific adenine glycosylase